MGLYILVTVILSYIFFVSYKSIHILFHTLQTEVIIIYLDKTHSQHSCNSFEAFFGGIKINFNKLMNKILEVFELLKIEKLNQNAKKSLDFTSEINVSNTFYIPIWLMENPFDRNNSFHVISLVQVKRTTK